MSVREVWIGDNQEDSKRADCAVCPACGRILAEPLASKGAVLLKIKCPRCRLFSLIQITD